MKRLIVFTILAGMLSGCAVKPASMKAEDGLSSRLPSYAVVLGERAADEISKVYPAGSTVLCVMSNGGKQAEVFAATLEHSLRRAGYAVSAIAERASVVLGYQTDVIESGKTAIGYWHIQASDGKQFSLSVPLRK